MIVCYVFLTVILSSYENVPSHRLSVPGKLSPWVSGTGPSPSPLAPSKMGEFWPYFQIFPGKEACDMMRQSFPASPNPRHSCSQAAPAAPEANLPWSVSALSGAGSSHTRGLLLHHPPAPELRAREEQAGSGLRASRDLLSSSKLSSVSHP